MAEAVLKCWLRSEAGDMDELIGTLMRSARPS